MNDMDSKVMCKVQELHAEVRRLRRTINVGVFIIGLATIVIFPWLFELAMVTGAFVLFAFLVSPVRGMIFESIFYRRDDLTPKKWTG